MTDVDWKARWEAGQIGFHLPEVNPALKTWIDRVERGARGQRIYVPLAGKSLDVVFLRERGHVVVASELVSLAVEQFFDAWGRVPVRIRRGAFEAWEADGVTFLVGDALEATPDVVGPVDAVYDRAALVALAPAQRAAYAKVACGLVDAGARMLLVTLEHDASAGPPFSVEPEEVASHFGDAFVIEALDVVDVTASSANLVAKGATFARERVSLLVRR